MATAHWEWYVSSGSSVGLFPRSKFCTTSFSCGNLPNWLFDGYVLQYRNLSIDEVIAKALAYW